MITKILDLLPAIVRHTLTAIRPQSRPLQKRLEWQSEFLFLPQKRPFLPASLANNLIMNFA
jgi:hypothetical protein